MSDLLLVANVADWKLMRRAKVFNDGKSHAVRISKDGDMILSTRDTDFECQNFLKEMRDLTGEERKEFVADRNLIETEPRDYF